MTTRSKKIIGSVVLILTGLPVVSIVGVLAWGSFSDQTNGTIVSSGVTRRYLLYVPETYDRSRPTPLVISLHPAAAWPAFVMNLSGWNNLAEEHGFIVAYPAGTGAFFSTNTRGANIWPMGPQSLGQDVKFISDLIDKLTAEYNIDSKRIYANGMSNGGGMAFVLSCKLPDRIAAVGVVSGALFDTLEQCQDSKPVPTIVFHGTADKLALYQGGSSPVAPAPFPSIPEWTAQLSRRNLCQGDPTEIRITASVRRLSYPNCADHSDVLLYSLEGAGHTWPGGKPLPKWIFGHTNDEISASRLMWDFFTKHPL